MSKVIFCLDCPVYQSGGYCSHFRKDVGALNPACDYAKEINQKFNPEDSTETTTEPTLKEEEMSAITPKQQETKVCPRCGEEKPLTEYYRDKKSPTGRKSWCKKCTCIVQAAKAREARALKRAEKAASASVERPTKPEGSVVRVAVREKLTDEQMVMALRANGWTVTCTRTITEEL